MARTDDSRVRGSRRICALALLSSVGVQAWTVRATPWPATVERTLAVQEQERTGAALAPDEIAAAVASISALRRAGSLDEARARFVELLDTQAVEQLFQTDERSAMAHSESLDYEAWSLEAWEMQLRVRTVVRDWLEPRCDEDDPRLLDWRYRLGCARSSVGDFAGARELLTWVLARREAQLPEDDALLLQTRGDLANALSRSGDPAGAVTQRDLMFTVRRRVLPPDDPSIVQTQRELASAHADLGNYARALELQEEVLATVLRTQPEDAYDVLDAWCSLADTYRLKGELARAHEIQSEQLAVWERIRAADDHAILRIKSSLAITLGELRRLDESIALFEEVLEVRERTLGADAETVLNTRLNLAAAYIESGNTEAARPLLEHIASVWERRHGPAYPALLSAQHNLAVVRARLGDLDGARELQERVLAASEPYLGPDHVEILTGRFNLAGTLYCLGEVAAARAMTELVHAALVEHYPPDHQFLLVSKSNLAFMLREAGDGAASLALEREVLAVRMRSLPDGHPDLLSSKTGLAGALFECGDVAAARVLTEEVHAARAAFLPPDHPDRLLSARDLAFVTNRSGNPLLTRERTRALLVLMLARAAALEYESPRVARAGVFGEAQRFADALYFAECSQPAEADTLDARLFEVHANLRLVSTGSSTVALAASRAPELVALRERLAEARTRLQDLGLAAPYEASALELWRKDLVARADERDRCERSLRAALGAAGMPRCSVTSAAVAAALAEDAIVVSYLRYWRTLDRDTATDAAPDRLDSLLAFVVLPSGDVLRVELGACAELEALATAWRSALGRPIQRGLELPGTTAVELELGRSLRARLLDPCLAATGNTPLRTVHVVSDDFLHLLPLDALPWTDERRVGDALQLRLEVSMRRLVAPPPPVTGAGTLVALGGADFDAEGAAAPILPIGAVMPPVEISTDRAEATTRFGALIQSRYEARTVGEQFEELVGAEPVVLTREHATKRAVVELAPRARYLHLATHGWFAPEGFHSMRDELAPSNDDALAQMQRARETVRGFAPETLCGLALAGANRGRDRVGRVLGILTAEELATLDLTNCELAVLSACETNVGIRRAGQGIQSLQSALHAAGARTSITSLWKVDDAATRRLMELFYAALWSDGLSCSDALWRAKVELRAEGSPICDWAGWVLSGDP